MADLRLFEVINPSDAATFYAPSIGIAAVAMLLLDGGRGLYGATDIEADESTPLFAFCSGGDAQQWLDSYGLWPLDDAIDKNREAIAAALESVALGKPADRRDFDDAVASITDPEARQAFIERRNDRRRSSMNNFEARAHEVASGLRRKEEATNGDS